jgi:hypothetical protein
MTTGPQEIERIVREVTRRLSLRAETQGSVSSPTNPSLVNEPVLQLQARVVTVSALEGRLDGIDRLIVPADAVVTPAVHDLLHGQEIKLLRSGHAPKATAAWGTLIVAVDGTLCPSASILEAVSALGYHAEPLQVAELAKGVGQLACRLTETTCRALWIAKRPAAAVCLANRDDRIRAAWAVDTASVASATASIAANLIVVDPTRHSRFEINNMIRTYLTTKTGGDLDFEP